MITLQRWITMESCDEFYVTLSSNVINNNYNNSIANFVTQLPSTIFLDSTWRVGLSEIHFTNSWCNLRNMNYIRIMDDFRVEPYNSPAFIPAGRYEDIESLLEEIEIQAKPSINLREVQYPPTLDTNHFTRRVVMKKGVTNQEGEDALHFEFDMELAEMLGLSQGFRSSYAHTIVTADGVVDVNPPVSENDKFEAQNSYDLTGGIHSLFVYCDVVDYSLVGDTRAQLLRLAHIPAASRFGDSIVDRFENPHYMPLSTKEISSIEIDIKDDTNTPIKFEFGRVKLVLHFKKWTSTT